MTLNERIKVWRKADTRNADGTVSKTRTLVTSEFVFVRPMSGSERLGSDQTEAYATHRFFMQNNTDILGSDIIVWNSTDYNIKFISSPSEQERYMYIDAERGGRQ